MILLVARIRPLPYPAPRKRCALLTSSAGIDLKPLNLPTCSEHDLDYRKCCKSELAVLQARLGPRPFGCHRSVVTQRGDTPSEPLRGSLIFLVAHRLRPIHSCASRPTLPYGWGHLCPQPLQTFYLGALTRTHTDRRPRSLVLAVSVP